jgi:enoyl-CoA hydratase/carnithine racemase
LLSEHEPEPIGAPVYVRSFGTGNRVTTTRARMGQLFPAEPSVLRDQYEHVLVRRDGHLLEVTINRPGSRNSLHPMANDELDHVFNACITADEAHAYGLVNRVVPAGTALDGARALAAEIGEGSPTSVRISLQVMEETRGIPDVLDAVNYPTRAFDDLMASEDTIEGLTAFAAKRRPQWRNR